VLDFGCGLGAWLDVLQDAGWETYGIEPGAKQARVAARRHRMLDSVPRDEGFDLAIANHVLEHLLDPVAVLRELAGALAPAGQLFVSVPDFGRVHLHRDLPYVANDLHLNSFGFSGLRSALALAGFEVEQHFEGPEWAALEKGMPTRLRVLARRSASVRFPVEDAPLEEAVLSLRELGRIESREWWEAAGGGVTGPPAPVDREDGVEPRPAAGGRGVLRRLVGRR
jgi:SAM-dependent methyltransferase